MLFRAILITLISLFACMPSVEAKSKHKSEKVKEKDCDNHCKKDKKREKRRAKKDRKREKTCKKKGPNHKSCRPKHKERVKEREERHKRHSKRQGKGCDVRDSSSDSGKTNELHGGINPESVEKIDYPDSSKYDLLKDAPSFSKDDLIKKVPECVVSSEAYREEDFAQDNYNGDDADDKISWPSIPTHDKDSPDSYSIFDYRYWLSHEE